jgi:macrolide-specific efflux system membrane fusion protein
MRSGMTATVTFLIAAKDDVLRVPTHALRGDSGQKSVLVPGADGVPREQAVETGLSDGRQTEVISGLNEGDKVLIAQVKRDSKSTGSASPFAPGARPSTKK